MNNLEKVFNGQWDELKGKIKTQWGKLTDSDLKQIDGSLKELIGQIKKYYGYEAAKIEDEVAQFLVDHDIGTIKGRTIALKDDAVATIGEIKAIVRDSVSEYFEKMKKSTVKAEEALLNYCKTNPLKTAGALLLAGFAFATLLPRNKNS